MKPLTIISAIAIMFLLLGVSFASAALCKNSRGYYSDCNSGSKSFLGYETYNIRDRASTPIFKGSYGNYRYQMYEHGDSGARDYFNSWFVPRYGGTYGAGPYFSGGYGYGGYGYHGGYGYRSPWYSGWFSWFWW